MPQRIAALYDIHGNLPALDAVLAEVDREEVDRILIGGDVVPGPLPGETIERLRALGERALFLRGNTDRLVVEAFDTLVDGAAPDRPRTGPWVEWTARAIDRRQRDMLASFAERVTLEVDGLGPTLFCHASPRDDEELLTLVTPERRWRAALEGVAEAVVVCGHTHTQLERRVGRWRLVNAGSVGLPYEGRTGAYWTLLGPGVEHRRTEYDVERALAEMRRGGGPDTDALVHESFVAPVPARTAAERLERQAAGG